MSCVKYSVTPFNQLALGSCFDEAYIPAFQSVGGDINQFILNRCTYFRYMGDSFCVSSYDLKKRAEIEKANGITSISIEGLVDNVVDKVIGYLNEGSLVICKTSDAIAYNERLKRNTQKSTAIHWMLFYGYDTERKVFDVLEHLTNVSATYESCIMDFEMLQKSYKLGFEYAKEENETMVVIRNVSGKSVKVRDFTSLYFEKCKSILDKIQLSYESLTRYMTTFSECNKVAEQYDLMVLNEVIRYFEKEIWIQNKAKIKLDKGIELLQKLYLVRTYCMKCLNNASEMNTNCLKNVCLETIPLVDVWYNGLFLLISK